MRAGMWRLEKHGLRNATRNNLMTPTRGRRAAFTIVELIVVISVIVMILAIAVPGLSAMNAEARLTTGAQSIGAMLTRAYYQAIADQNMTAVRLLPAAWDAQQKEKDFEKGRQHAVVYRYAGVTTDPARMGQVYYDEYFVRQEELNSAVLPSDVWAAPLPALDTSSEALTLQYFHKDGDLKNDTARPVAQTVLRGTIGQFEASASVSDFLNADDFMIVIDPEAGVLGGVPQPVRLRGFVPDGDDGYEACRIRNNGPLYQRYSFGGVVLYNRDDFAALGKDASVEERQTYLRDNGRPQFAQRFGGGLIAGVTHPE